MALVEFVAVCPVSSTCPLKVEAPARVRLPLNVCVPKNEVETGILDAPKKLLPVNVCDPARRAMFGLQKIAFVWSSKPIPSPKARENIRVLLAPTLSISVLEETVTGTSLVISVQIIGLTLEHSHCLMPPDASIIKSPNNDGM